MKKIIWVFLAVVLVFTGTAGASEFRLEPHQYYIADRGRERVVLYTKVPAYFNTEEIPGVLISSVAYEWVRYMGYERSVTIVVNQRLARHLPSGWVREMRLIEPPRYSSPRDGRREPYRPYKRRTPRPYYEDEIEDIIADRTLDFFDDVVRRSLDDVFERMF